MANIRIDLGAFNISLCSNGGVRIGGKIGDTYISRKIVKPKKKKVVHET